MNKIIVAFAIASVIMLTAKSFGQTVVLRVDGSLGAGTEDGSSWATAYRTLSAALASVPSESTPTQVWVARGTYIPTVQLDANSPPNLSDPRTATFAVRRRLLIQGGFLGNAHPSGGEQNLSDADPANNITILSGDIDGNDGQGNTSGNAYHVILFKGAGASIISSLRTTIDGFTIIGGNADGSDKNSIGGGMIEYPDIDIEDSGGTTPLIRNCILVSNHAEGAGGAVATQSSAMEFRNCKFIENTTDGAGYDSWAGGGAIAAATGEVRLVNCRFEGNHSGENGGALRGNGPSSTRMARFHVVNSEFLANTADGLGGAIFNPPNAAQTITNCLFAGNVASGSGDAGGAVFVHTSTIRKSREAHAADRFVAP